MTQLTPEVEGLLHTPSERRSVDRGHEEGRVRDDGAVTEAVLTGSGRKVQTGPPRNCTREFGANSVAILLATALSSWAVVWIFFYQLTLLSGAFGFILCWYACFLTMYWVVTALTVDRSAAADWIATTVVASCAALMIGASFYIVIWVFLRGVADFTIGFLWRTMAFYQPADPHLFSDVGVGHAIVGTVEQVGLAALFAVPLAFLTAIFLNEVGGFGTRFVRTIVTAMSGVPSIVAGVFILRDLHRAPRDRVLGLRCLHGPVRTHAPVGHPDDRGSTPSRARRLARCPSSRLGASEWRTVRQVVLPTARSGLITAVVLGIAIAAGETAPLIFTAFGNNDLNYYVFHGPQGSLPLVLYENIFQAQAVVVQLAFTAAFVLLTIVLILFVLARLLGRRRTSKGRLRRLVSAHVRSPRKV